MAASGSVRSEDSSSVSLEWETSNPPSHAAGKRTALTLNFQGSPRLVYMKPVSRTLVELQNDWAWFSTKLFLVTPPQQCSFHGVHQFHKASTTSHPHHSSMALYVDQTWIWWGTSPVYTTAATWAQNAMCLGRYAFASQLICELLKHLLPLGNPYYMERTSVTRYEGRRYGLGVVFSPKRWTDAAASLMNQKKIPSGTANCEERQPNGAPGCHPHSYFPGCNPQNIGPWQNCSDGLCNTQQPSDWKAELLSARVGEPRAPWLNHTGYYKTIRIQRLITTVTTSPLQVTSLTHWWITPMISLHYFQEELHRIRRANPFWYRCW